jgi:hypothetical protein
MDWDKYIEEQKKFKKLPISQQLKLLQAEAQECDTIIGKIYVQNPPTFENRNQLKTLFGKATLVDEFVIGGQGDTTIELIFAVDNLLIGVVYFAFWRGSFSMHNDCAVYRLSKNESLESLDKNKIKKALFGF